MDLFYDPDIRLLTVQFRRGLCRWQYDNLTAVFWRFYWNPMPGAEIWFQKRRYPLTPDRVLLVTAHTGISPRLPRPPVSHLFAHFIVAPPFDRLRPAIYAFPADLPALRRVRRLLGRAESDGSGAAPFQVSLAMLGLLHGLLARIPPADLSSAAAAPDLLEENLDYIERHIHRPLSNRELAGRLGASVNSLLRQYKTYLRMPPQAFVRRKRIEKACFLLHDSRLSIKQIAADTGFLDRYHFSRVFKALNGLTPREYRRRLGL